MNAADKKANDGMQKVVNQLSEYLGSFMLVGYDINGDRWQWNYIPTSKDLDAIQQQMEDTIQKKLSIVPEVRVVNDDT